MEAESDDHNLRVEYPDLAVTRTKPFLKAKVVGWSAAARPELGEIFKIPVRISFGFRRKKSRGWRKHVRKMKAIR